MWTNQPERLKAPAPLFMRALGEEANAEARVYMTGGATAVLHGWRPSTIDIDIKIVAEAGEVFRAIPVLKERLAITDDFKTAPVRLKPDTTFGSRDS